jgi:transcriptional regulator with XRE-family HTH domain
MSYRLSSRNLTVEDMEEMTGVEHLRFRDYLKGQKPNLSNFEIIKIAKALGMDVEIKVSFDDETAGIP